MKLIIKSACLVGNGKHAERGDIVDTQQDDKTADKVAYTLISTGRALAMRRYDKDGNDIGSNPEASALLEETNRERAEVSGASEEELAKANEAKVPLVPAKPPTGKALPPAKK